MGVRSNVFRMVLAALSAALLVVACTVSLPNDAKYKCDADRDCGGDGFICFHPESASAFCCKPGEEGCVAGTGGGGGGGTGGGTDGGTESCNGVDDDGDGQIDEGFDLQTNTSHCGACNNACAALQTCTAGVCSGTGETQCADGQDNDTDTLTDCADPDCNSASCGIGCICGGGVKTEAFCSLGNDEDGDGLLDCADPDCELKSCGQGCVCFQLTKSEVGCSDGQDNDGDTRIDCADVEADGGGDCPTGRLCRANPNTSVCGGAQCRCNGVLAPAAENKCADGVDNDCSGSIDCADQNCNTLSCFADGGLQCFCRGGTRAENANAGACENKFDDDGDGLEDCLDMLPDGGGDCPVGIRCRKPNNQFGACRRLSSGGDCN